MKLFTSRERRKRCYIPCNAKNFRREREKGIKIVCEKVPGVVCHKTIRVLFNIILLHRAGVQKLPGINMMPPLRNDEGGAGDRIFNHGAVKSEDLFD